MAGTGYIWESEINGCSGRSSCWQVGCGTTREVFLQMIIAEVSCIILWTGRSSRSANYRY